MSLMQNGSGDFGAALQLNNGTGTMRPWIGNDGHAYATVYSPKADGTGNVNDPSCYTNIRVNAATLRRDEWKQLDDALLRVARTRLGGYADLLNMGLTYNLTDAFGTTILETHTSGDPFEAEVSMDGITRSKNDNETFDFNYLPIPIVHVDYDLNLRQLAASRRMGNPLDTNNLETASRKVNESVEKMLFTDSVFKFGGGFIYSYLNHPSRNTVVLQDWLTASPQEILEDVLKLKQANIDSHMYGPYKIYVPTAVETRLDEDFLVGDEAQGLASGNLTIRERILKIASIDDIAVSDTMTAGNVVLVQMTSDVVRAVEGVGLSNVQWSSHGNFKSNYKVFRISVPQIRADQNGNSGVAHGSW